MIKNLKSYAKKVIKVIESDENIEYGQFVNKQNQIVTYFHWKKSNITFVPQDLTVKQPDTLMENHSHWWQTLDGTPASRVIDGCPLFIIIQ